MRRIHLFAMLMFAARLAFAQPVVAPTNEPLGSPRGEDLGGYNVLNSFELGYRFRSVDGNLGKYRSDVNFANGVRLLGSQLTVNSKDGRGRFFDEIVLSTQGLGNDPYQSAILRIQKNKLYRYDMMRWQNDYFNPALTIAGGQHFMDTSRTLQDHSLVLLPQSSIRLLAGYTRVAQSGPALSTIQLFDARGDQYPLFENVRRSQDEYRIGAEARLAGLKLGLTHAWEYFKDDSVNNGTPLPAGNNPADQNTLTGFYRAQPYHGSTPSWRAYLLSENIKWLNLNGRFTYAGGRRNFIFDESARGTDRFGGALNRQTLVFGNARRPVTAANLTAALFPEKRISVINHTSFHHTRIDGDGSLREFNNNVAGLSFVNFQFLGIRAFSHQTDLNFRVTDAVVLRGGYQYSTRRIRSVEQTAFLGAADRLAVEQNNRLHSGMAGARLRPVKGLTILFDAEMGRADRPFYPVSEGNYHLLGARLQYRTKKLTVGGGARSNYNFNSVSLSAFASRSRSYFGDLSWQGLDWLGVDAGYSKLHLDTAGGINYFLGFNLVEGERSLYISNIHNVHSAVRVSIRKRVDLFGGFNRVQDTGDGRATATGGARFTSLAIFQAAQVFPLSFDSPMARVSVRVHKQVRVNFGYQYYRYNERFQSLQNYRAHTGYTSLSWAF